MTRKATERPPRKQPAETRWYEAGILNMEAEAATFREEAARLAHERMERDTGDRGRRTYDLAEEVDEHTAAELIYELSDWSRESSARITLRIISPGGSVISGLAIYDFVMGLRGSGTPVDTLALGWAASMASVLLQCGEVRRIGPNASVLIHEERTYREDAPVLEKVTDMEDRFRFERSLEDRMDRILAERSVLSFHELREAYRRKDWWLTAQEAVDHGFADELWTPGR